MYLTAGGSQLTFSCPSFPELQTVTFLGGSVNTARGTTIIIIIITFYLFTLSHFADAFAQSDLELRKKKIFIHTQNAKQPYKTSHTCRGQHAFTCVIKNNNIHTKNNNECERMQENTE